MANRDVKARIERANRRMEGEAKAIEAMDAVSSSPRCPKCGFVMCQEFDETPINALATLVTPNGKYRCCSGRCAGAPAERGA